MTVQDLIDKLEAMPRDAEVIRDFMSDFCDVPDEDPTLFLAEKKTIVLRKGRYMYYDKKTWPKDETPNFVTVVHFRGN